ncbi:hypothetical protein PENTCL1PPCAC_16476, partial [Pristionchus entomophagus]
VAGIATNSLFLYLVRRHTRPSLGTYKQLLTVFASFDLFLTLLHLAIEPRDGFEHPRLIVALIVFDIVIFVSIVTAVTLGTLTYIGIRRAQKISKSTANIQFTLLVAVTAQTLVPFLFVYVPYFACLNFPLLGIPAATMVGIGTFLTSCFPAWDAVIVILLMTDYRHAVMRM